MRVDRGCPPADSIRWCAGADGQGHHRAHPAARRHSVAGRDRRYLQSRRSKHTCDWRGRHDDGDARCAPARRRRQPESDHHARADLLRSPRSNGRTRQRKRPGLRGEAGLHQSARARGVALPRLLASQTARRNSHRNGEGTRMAAVPKRGRSDALRASAHHAERARRRHPSTLARGSHARRGSARHAGDAHRISFRVPRRTTCTAACCNPTRRCW